MLTDAACRAAKPDSKPVKLTDSGGLLLFVSPAGGKLWRLRYRFEGREKLLSFGPYPEVKLADARALRDKAKKLLAEGRDPGVKETLHGPLGDSFEAVAAEWIDAQAAGWTLVHTQRILARFRRDVFPSIGAVPIADLKAQQILTMLRPIELRAPDIAGRVRQTCGAIMRYAVASGARLATL